MISEHVLNLFPELKGCSGWESFQRNNKWSKRIFL